MRALAFALIMFGAVGASYASQPGHPLDCSDWVFYDPNLQCHDEISYPCPVIAGEEIPECSFSGDPQALDNTGGVLWLREQWVGRCGITDLRQIQVLRSIGPTHSIIAVLNARCVDPTRDLIDDAYVNSHPIFDPVSGKLRIRLLVRCTAGFDPSVCPYPNADHAWIAGLTGFTSLFEVLQSYSRSNATLGYDVPVMPEGMRAADHFDTYYGSVTRPLDLSQAHPLQCSYPSTSPQVGDFEQITEPVPTPAPEHANYVLTTVTYQGQTRAGRQALDGHLRGRDASLLPACVIERKASNTKSGEAAR